MNECHDDKGRFCSGSGAAGPSAGQSTSRHAGTANATGTRRKAAAAIPRSEEYQGHTKEGGSLSWRNNNPGNLEFGHTAVRLGAIGASSSSKGRFAKFSTPEAGMKALQTSLTNRGSLTVKDLMKDYAPQKDGNDLDGYLRFLKAKGIDIDKPVGRQVVPLSEAIKTYEGWKEGTINKK